MLSSHQGCLRQSRIMCTSRNRGTDEAGCSELQNWGSHFTRCSSALCGNKRILVRNIRSLISIGTERSTIELGRRSLAGKAAARPDLVRRVWEKARKEGLLKTWQEAMGRLDTPTPLGYSCAGLVEECGLAAQNFHLGPSRLCGAGFCQSCRVCCGTCQFGMPDSSRGY